MSKDGFGLPLAQATLALTLAFDLSAVPDWRSLRSRDCGAALAAALAATSLRPRARWRRART